MEKLKSIIDQHSRWQPLEIFIERIEAHIDVDFSISLENSKTLLETIGHEIGQVNNVELASSSSTNAILKKAFVAIGYSGDDLVTQISSSLANIGQQIGNLRNEIGTSSHGKSLQDVKERNDKVDHFTRELLIGTTEIVASFLIRGFETMTEKTGHHDVIELPNYNKNNEFNDFWDESFGEFEMGGYSYPASEILYNVDIQAYVTEHKVFKAGEA